MKDKKLCFGCRQEGHYLRDCPQRRYHQQRLTHPVDIGHGAAYILENDAEPCNDSHSEILEFVDTAFAGNEDDAHDEFDEWICTVLDFLDNRHASDSQLAHNQDTNFIKLSVDDLNDLINELAVYVALPVTKHLLLDTGSPKSIASEEWLRQAQWSPVKKVNLPDYIQPFRLRDILSPLSTEHV